MTTYKEKFVLKALDEELFTLYTRLSFPPFHFLFKQFNDLNFRVVQSGLIEYWIYANRKPIMKWKPEKPAPVVLT